MEERVLGGGIESQGPGSLQETPPSWEISRMSVGLGHSEGGLQGCFGERMALCLKSFSPPFYIEKHCKGANEMPLRVQALDPNHDDPISIPRHR